MLITSQVSGRRIAPASLCSVLVPSRVINYEVAVVRDTPVSVGRSQLTRTSESLFGSGGQRLRLPVGTPCIGLREWN